MNDVSWFIPDDTREIMFEYANYHCRATVPAMNVDGHLFICQYPEPVRIVYSRRRNKNRVIFNLSTRYFYVGHRKSGKIITFFEPWSRTKEWWEKINEFYKYHQDQIESDDIDFSKWY